MEENDPTNPAGLLSLPTEVLSQIIELAVWSDEPVDLLRFMDMGRHSHAYQRTYEMHAARLGEKALPALRLSVAWWVNLLPESQIQHYRDWVFVNGTCRRLRDVGKPALFSKKPFLISHELLIAFRRDLVTNMSSLDLALSKAHIRNIVVPIPSRSFKPFIALPKYHMFKNLQSLSVRVIENSVDFEPFLLGPKYGEDTATGSPSAGLLENLRKLGLRVDKLAFSLDLIPTRSTTSQDVMGVLEEDTCYALLKQQTRRTHRTKN